MANQIKMFWNVTQKDFQDLEDAVNGFIGLYKVQSVEIKKYDEDENFKYFMAIVLYDDGQG